MLSLEPESLLVPASGEHDRRNLFLVTLIGRKIADSLWTTPVVG